MSWRMCRLVSLRYCANRKWASMNWIYQEESPLYSANLDVQSMGNGHNSDGHKELSIGHCVLQMQQHSVHCRRENAGGPGAQESAYLPITSQLHYQDPCLHSQWPSSERAGLSSSPSAEGLAQQLWAQSQATVTNTAQSSMNETQEGEMKPAPYPDGEVRASTFNGLVSNFRVRHSRGVAKFGRYGRRNFFVIFVGLLHLEEE